MRRPTALALLSLSLIAAGCNGPTAKGKEKRAEANARMNLVSSRVGYDQATQAFHAGQFERALKDVKSAIAKSPDQADYQVLLGRIYLETHRLEPAMQAFTAAIALDENCDEACYYRGVIYERWSNDEVAAENYHRAFEIDPTKLSYLLAAAECEVAMGNLDTARALLEPKARYFENHAAIHQLLGQIAMMQSDPDTAVERFRKAQLLLPEDRILAEELFRAQLAGGDLAGALESVRRLQLSSETPDRDLLRLEARCLAQLGRTSEARSVFVEVTRLHPEDVTAWIDLAIAAHALGDLRRLGHCAARVEMLAPDRWEAPFFRGLVARAERRSREAIEELSKATELAPEETLPRIVLGMELRSAGRNDEAYRVLAGTLRIEPDHPVAKRLVAEVRPSAE
ncbi:MAG: tetratricopeptide repeat protein [Phycisphaerales bacterium]